MLVRARASKLATVFALLACASVSAQRYDDDFVDPFEVHSADAAWTLFVDPHTPHGKGPASYRLSHGKDVVWTKELPWTLRDVQLGDDGAFAGTAEGPGDRRYLRLELIGSDGLARFEMGLAYEDSVPDGPTYPFSKGLVFDREHDRVTFRVVQSSHDNAAEVWLVVRWSNGESLATLRLKPDEDWPDENAWIQSVKPVHGLPLFALCWIECSYDSVRGASYGTRFELIDLKGRDAWSLDLPYDFEFGYDTQIGERFGEWMRAGGSTLESTVANRFDALLVADAQRVTFEVARDAAAKTGWTVREVARVGHTIDMDDWRKRATPATKVDSLELSFLGAVELQHTEQAPGGLPAFEIDDRGRFGYLVSEPDKPSRFVLRDAHAAVVVEWPLDLHAAEATLAPSVTWIRGDRWFVHAATYGEYPHAVAWWLDVSSGAATAIADFDCAPIQSVDGTSDGGFVVLTQNWATNPPRGTGLRSFDAEAKWRWQRPSFVEGPESSLFSAEGLRVSPRGEIGVLDGRRHRIQRFDLQGGFIGMFELDELSGHEANHPAELGVTLDGVWLVHDLNGSPPVLCVSRDGALTSTFTPHFADGRAFVPEGGIQVAHDGRMWTTDGYAFLRLDATGVVDLIAGDAPDNTKLGELECSFIDPSGRILLADERTHAVHVFDREGKRVAICDVAPKRASVRTAVDAIAVSMDGNIHVAVTDYDTTSYTAFDSSGARLGAENFNGRVVFQPAKASRWTIVDDEIELFDTVGALKEKLRRGFDHKWLDGLHETSVAADGSLATVSRGKLHVFSSDGEPAISLEAPGLIGGEPLAFAGTRVFVIRESSLWSIDLASHVVRKATLGKELSEGGHARLAWRADTNELCVLDEQAKKLLRYRVSQ